MKFDRIYKTIVPKKRENILTKMVDRLDRVCYSEKCTIMASYACRSIYD